MLRTHVSGGINWNWYLQGDFNDAEQTVTLKFHERFHKFEPGKHPQATGSYELLEDSKRTVYGVRANGSEYLVLNPRTIYEGYRDFSAIEWEMSK